MDVNRAISDLTYLRAFCVFSVSSELSLSARLPIQLRPNLHRLRH